VSTAPRLPRAIPLDLQVEQPRPLLRLAAGFLVFIALLYQYVGTNPLSGGDVDTVQLSAGGSVVNQVSRIGLFVLAVPFFLIGARQTLTLLKAAAPLLAVYAWLALTILWSDYPAITLRRLIGEGLLLFVLVAVIPNSLGMRQLFWSLAAALAAVILLNWISIALFPAIAESPGGTRGIYSSKNTAGSVGLVACVVLGGACFVATDWRKRALLFVLWLSAAAFLYKTESKTSQGAAVLILVGFPIVYLMFTRSRANGVLIAIASLVAVAVAVMLVAFFDLSREWVLAAIFGDPTLTQRTTIWSALLQNLRERPFLGVGWAAFWEVGREFNPINAPANAFFRDAALINTAHNGYIDMMLQAGLIGLMLKVFVIARLIYVYAGLVVRLDLALPHRRAFAALMACALAAVVNNMTESIIFRAGDPFSFTFQMIYLIGEYARLQSARWAVSPQFR
jgi:O-antigen ligase